MTGLTGAGALSRLALRRDRWLLPLWLYLLTASVAGTAYSLGRAYPSAAERAALAAGAAVNPSLLALYGPLPADSLGGLTVWRVGGTAAVATALLAVVTVIRHTRGNEEAGRAELLGSTVTGRQAALAAGFLTACGAATAAGALIAVGCTVAGLPAVGSLALGTQAAMAGWVFAALAAVCAQLTRSARAARGMAMGAVGVAYLLRAMADSIPALSGLGWASPLGWGERLAPFGAQRWWVAALAAAAAAALMWTAALLSARRDMGAATWRARGGGRPGGRWLGGPAGLAWRLQRGAVLGWLAGFVTGGAVLGGLAHGIGALVTSPQVRTMMTRAGGVSSLLDAYFAVVCTMGGVLAAAFGVAAALRLRGEETAQRAEPVLAGPAGRLRWASGHLLVAVAAPAGALAVFGAAAGAAAAAMGEAGPAGAAGAVTRMLGGALAQLPAVWVMTALVVAVFGLAPRASVGAGWGAFAMVAVVAVAGPALGLSHWLLDVSPFTDVPKLPGAAFAAGPLAWLTLAAGILLAAGLAGLRRRDLG